MGIPVNVTKTRAPRWIAIRLGVLFAALCGLAAFRSSPASAQSPGGQLTSREELSAAAMRAEHSGNHVGAAAIHSRLTDGDFQPGDRIILAYFSDIAHSDTLVVRAGRVVDLPGKAVLELSGVLRSELKDRLAAELLKYVKAEAITVTPLTRIGVLGEVAHPGYFAVRSDIPITEAIMIAGGPTGSADMDRSFVRRESREYRSADSTRQAVATGLTLDQFGLTAGDEIVVGRQTQAFGGTVGATLGLAASIAAIFVAVRH
jgi:protein involved in polysaccharide export with SLBB domain